MHIPSTLTALLALPLLTFAGPASALPSEQATLREYYLKTADATNQPSHFNNLYVQAYHTGAGTNDAVLVSNRTRASRGFLNRTVDEPYYGPSSQQFNLNTPTIPWSLALSPPLNYAGWHLVYINVGYGTGGFFLNGTGLQWNSTEFGGWIACDWWHNLPQLFWRYSFYDYDLPSSCAIVQLVPEYI